MDFTDLELINVFIVLGASALVVIAVVLLLPYIKKQQGYPYEAVIEGAFVPYLLLAIGAAFALLMSALEEVDKRASTVDVAKLAGLLYDKVATVKQLKPVTYIVTRDAFIERVVAGWAWADEQFDLQRGELADLYSDWSAKQ